VGNQKLLFPGDAQIENWEWALKVSPEAETNLTLLKDATVYKCGHHGSRNATPKTLWNNFARRNDDEDNMDRIITLLSTAEGRHGDPERNTEVPRVTLVAELEEFSDMRSTETVDANSDEPYIDVRLEID
jgi:hypothetical protein